MAQIRRLESIKSPPSPLTMTDISGGEWKANTRNKTGTREAMKKQFDRRGTQESPFRLPNEDTPPKFNQFWEYATNGDYIYGAAVRESRVGERR